MSEDEEDLEDDDSFPLEHVTASRKNSRLQRSHPVSPAKTKYVSQAKACPKCGATPEQLAWFYFESPPWTWEHLCGRAGWMTVCDKCHLQVDFFLQLMN